MGLLKPMEKWLLKRVERPNFQHVFLGNVNHHAQRGTGFHHRYRGKNPPTARVRRDPNGHEIKAQHTPWGAYKARVDVRDENGNWYQKQAWSSFFPDDWTPQQVNEAIGEAFKNSSPDPANPNKWRGVYDGKPIEGFYAGGQRKGWHSAWPVV
ncbi:EndoU domain-containing protein [Thermomonospora echinospora]|nr:EndoU domain-containing protein [Thermomonospora echinospora]